MYYKFLKWLIFSIGIIGCAKGVIIENPILIIFGVILAICHRAIAEFLDDITDR